MRMMARRYARFDVAEALPRAADAMPHARPRRARDAGILRYLLMRRVALMPLRADRRAIRARPCEYAACPCATLLSICVAAESARASRVHALCTVLC